MSILLKSIEVASVDNPCSSLFESIITGSYVGVKSYLYTSVIVPIGVPTGVSIAFEFDVKVDVTVN
jgi:hypothetical protein